MGEKKGVLQLGARRAEPAALGGDLHALGVPLGAMIVRPDAQGSGGHVLGVCLGAL